MPLSQALMKLQDFSQEITIAASGEMDELKRKLNSMILSLKESVEKSIKTREAAELANKTKSEWVKTHSLHVDILT